LAEGELKGKVVSLGLNDGYFDGEVVVLGLAEGSA
jgi:hypothetical protein